MVELNFVDYIPAYDMYIPWVSSEVSMNDKQPKSNFHG